MQRTLRIAFSLGLAGAFYLPAQAQERDKQQGDEQRQQANQEHARGQYHFRQQDAKPLRQNYKDVNRVDVHHRGHLVAGGRLPGDWRARIRPVPESVIRELPPPPPGYVFGYFDGYAVVYDPNTGMIADVIDLTNLP